ncbi:cupin domain-containing protein [Azospirillum canadense]|uniref:cupin domain-containing protein n=1 Tax=Azospirillum canadense TaxID=403962 RepID=UPI0022277408|nr:cupin domain-containing protein [Azospirillum canadense]MCW2236775.1 quercetin dioxygenase-like cupin family protein [Azospirillum canadense]
MADSSVKKVDADYSPTGAMGQRYLASGKLVSMRLWDEEPLATDKAPSRRDYETVGFVIAGRAELHIEGQIIQLRPGDSWVVPKGAEHAYRILERFQAVEATSPPAQVHGRDE